MNTVNSLPINFLKAVQHTTNYETQIYANMLYTVQKSTYKSNFDLALNFRAARQATNVTFDPLFYRHYKFISKGNLRYADLCVYAWYSRKSRLHSRIIRKCRQYILYRFIDHRRVCSTALGEVVLSSSMARYRW